MNENELIGFSSEAFKKQKELRATLEGIFNEVYNPENYITENISNLLEYLEEGEDEDDESSSEE